MPKILVRSVDQAEATMFPEMPGLTSTGAVESRPLIRAEAGALSLWHHDLGEGAEVRFDRPDHGHLLYVWNGQALAGGEAIGFDDIVVIERHGMVTVRAAGGPVSLLHYFSPAPETPGSKAQGRVHIRRKKSLDRHVHPQTTITLYADGSEACGNLWFHSGETPDGMLNFVEQPHYHTQDEIIFVVSGSMMVGPRRVGAGTVLAVAANTVYSFAVKEEKLHFVNFRAGESFVSVVEDGKRGGPEMSERQFITGLPVEA